MISNAAILMLRIVDLIYFIEEISSAELASPKEGESLKKRPFYPISIQKPTLFRLKMLYIQAVSNAWQEGLLLTEMTFTANIF